MADAFDRYVPEMIETRRRIHKRPELGWTEFETTAIVAKKLTELGFEIHLGREVVNPDAVLGRDPKAVEAAITRAREAGVPEELLSRMDGYTGCVGILDTGRPGPTLAFRHDMDALPIQDNKDRLCGRIKLIFQPSEEGTRGAGAMVAAGVVDDVDWFFGAHVGVTAKTGHIQLCADGYLATTKFDVNFTGIQSHAGAKPEAGRSALLAAANAAIMLNAISRTSEGDTRVSVGRLDAGEGRNITPAHAHMECEVRGSTHEANEFMFSRAQEVVKGAADMLGVKYDLIKTGQATTLVTTPEAMETMRKAAEAVPGVTVEDIHHCGGSEDCTLFMRRVAEHGGNPGFFLFGCENKGHHRPDFDIQDTVNLKPGFEVFTNIATAVCGRKD